MSTSRMEVFTLSPNHDYNHRSMLQIEIEHIFNRLVEKSCRGLRNYAFIRPLEGDARRNLGDYVCLSVLVVVEELRKKGFYQKKPKDIAKGILREFRSERTHVIDQSSLQLHDAGIITMRVDATWIAKRIESMLSDGINTWAPVLFKRRERAVIVSRGNMEADMIRASCIKDALFNMFLFSGLDVLDVGNEFLAPSNIGLETETIRHGVRELKADMMVYVTPHLEFTEECFTVAKSKKWFRADREAILACCGYRFLSSDQERKMDSLWNTYYHQKAFRSAYEKARDAGYTADGFFDCLLRYTSLKSNRLADFAFFDIEEMVDKEGNTLVNLLRTSAKIRSMITKPISPGKRFKNIEVLAGKEERELGLHLVEFTEVIDKACRAFVTDIVCEYLFNLSKLFMSYYHARCYENRVALARATEVVMCECFRLLGINPSREHARYKPFVPSVGRPINETKANDDRSRFELFTLSVEVPHPEFREGSIFGDIWVKDANGERSDGWTRQDAKNCCYVSYFGHEWHKPLDITYGSLISFGDPSCRRSVSLSSSFEVMVLLHAMTKNKDKCCLVYHDKHVEALSRFWDKDAKAERGTLLLKSYVGRVLVNYYLLKDAVDASMELTFRSSNPNDRVRIYGSIMVSYGDNMGKDDFLGQYKSTIFKHNNYELTGEQVVLPLHKSLLAVPANGNLRIEAFLMDLESKKIIVRDTADYLARLGNPDDNWCIKWENFSLNLKMAWS